MKQRFILVVALVVVVAVNSGCVPRNGVVSETLRDAGQLDKHPRIAQYLTSIKRQRSLYQVAMYWERALGLNADCGADALIKPAGFTLLYPIVFAEGAEHPHEGAWQERFVFERCGQQKTYNAVFVARKGAEPEKKVLPPGTTNASLQLLLDAMKTAKLAAYLKLMQGAEGQRCTELELIDTALTQPAHDEEIEGKTVHGVWNEEWTVSGCGASVTVTGTFVPNEHGGTSFTFD